MKEVQLFMALGMENKDGECILKVKLEVAEKVKLYKEQFPHSKSSFLVQNYSYLYYSSDLLVGSSILGYGPFDLELKQLSSLVGSASLAEKVCSRHGLQLRALVVLTLSETVGSRTLVTITFFTNVPHPSKSHVIFNVSGTNVATNVASLSFAHVIGTCLSQ